jgi:hypothetical protein
VFIITPKDLLVIRKSDGVKLFEKDYFEQAKEWSNKQDRLTNPYQMRELREFRLLTSTLTILSNPNSITLSLILLRTQAIQAEEGDQFYKKTELVHIPLLFLCD